MQKYRLNDTFFTALVAGGIATVVQISISWVLASLGVIEQHPTLLHARLLTNEASPDFAMLLLGVLTNIIAGILFAMVIIFFFKITGTDYAEAKGGFMGLVFAEGQFLFLSRLFKQASVTLPNPATQWHTFIVYLIWGIIVGYIVKRYSSIGKPRKN